METSHQPVALLILDGWGLGRPDDPNNAVARAKTPYMDLLAKQYPATTLACSGEEVGLPAGQMGNSEVGHLNIGAGRVVYQELTRISKAIRAGDFFRNQVLCRVMDRTKQTGGALHFIGLLSDGGVHSHITHLYALLEMAKRRGLTNVFVHGFLDGRDVPPTSAGEYVAALTGKLAELGCGQIASLAGRYYAMDRDKRWERTEKAYRALVYREGERAATAAEAVAKAYQRGETDEFVLPTVIESAADGRIKAGDGLVFFNFRPDRARQLTRAFVDHEFDSFDRRNGFMDLNFAMMTRYDETLAAPVVYEKQHLRNTLGEVFSQAGRRQLRIAETEKYAHVTFFFNGGAEIPFAGEERILIPSPKVATYDLCPAMSAGTVTNRVVEEINRGRYDLIILNYANGDMVGHTGQLPATIEAVSFVDQCVGRVVEAMNRAGGTTFITADHGNAEVMSDPATGEPFTAHTTNRVPFIMVAEQRRTVKLRAGRLADIAPTMLEVAGLAIPPEMTGGSLIRE